MKGYGQSEKELKHGEEWFKLRSMVNPILMQPRNVLQYVDRMNLVADELNDNIKYLSEQNSNGEMPENFNTELYKWSLESIGVVTMDKHLGCLKRNVETDSEPQKLIQNVLQLFPLMYKLDVMPSLWKVISTPDLRKFFKVSDFMTDTNLKYINQCMKKLESQKTDQEDKTNVLQKLIKGDRDLAVVMALDMMTAGIDTTGRILGAALYFLAKNPEAQQQLRKEALTLLKIKDAPVTTEILSKASYLKAVIKETLRVAPIGGGNLRTTTDVVTNHLILCKTDQHFARANKFLPERWLSSTVGELSYKNVNPFVYAPFGYGPRGCVGKRLANLELEVALLKVIRNFEFKWPHEDMVFEVKLFYGMARPLKLHVKPLND
ncbi:p450 domain containing protein [Asbolus verrucosus]|uniref:p450 domain containing protein n=1 Tax=Asbolus verrucosus TaxID=1661398 RepID=A0A482VFE9_ASBVE|nr:p450 domain containing protein [Asbolus verrucosus]